MSDIKLPPMPEPESLIGGFGGASIRYREHCELMQTYARQAVLMERERCAVICDQYPLRDPAEDGNGYWAAEECAAAIRANPSPSPTE